MLASSGSQTYIDQCTAAVQGFNKRDDVVQLLRAPFVVAFYQVDSIRIIGLVDEATGTKIFEAISTDFAKILVDMKVFQVRSFYPTPVVYNVS